MGGRDLESQYLRIKASRENPQHVMGGGGWRKNRKRAASVSQGGQLTTHERGGAARNGWRGRKG